MPLQFQEDDTVSDRFDTLTENILNVRNAYCRSLCTEDEALEQFFEIADALYNDCEKRKEL